MTEKAKTIEKLNRGKIKSSVKVYIHFHQQIQQKIYKAEI